jgi:bacillithiol biosynthesis cysteine-adding enzyme BshC
MQKFTFQREATGLFSEQQNRLIYKQEELLSFIDLPFSSSNFAKQAARKEKQYTLEQRELICDVLEDAYALTSVHEKVRENLSLLKQASTFTVTTGHQIPIFTGPLFFIYKLLHVIRLSEEINAQNDDFKTVPVYWMAAEDHDFEEVKWVEIFNKTMEWNSQQKGPVGRFELEGFEQLKSEFAQFFSGEALEEVSNLLSHYEGVDFASATFNLVNRLFGKYGLIILNADHPKLKSSFIPVLEKEIQSNFSFAAVVKTDEQMLKEGMKVQVHARQINLFYIEKGLRERIIHLDDGFIIDGKGKFSQDGLLELVRTQPERFSPNVILRPVYQEFVLPNLCYVGGVGEIAYWLQLKGVFDVLSLPFPMLSVRNSLMWIDGVSSKKIAKIDLHLEELFLDTEELKKRYVLRNQGDELDMSEVERTFLELKNQLTSKVMKADPGLEKFVSSELVRMEKQIQAVRDKMYRSIKARHDQALISIDQLKAKLFPNNGLQERSVNLFQLCAGGKVEERLDHLYHFIDPFEKDFIVIRE